MSCHIEDPKRDFYIHTKSELDDYEVNPTVIIGRKYLEHVVGIDVVPEEVIAPVCDKWYPYVNSYYPFTEDVDAVGRVNHLLATKSSSESICSLGIQDKKKSTPYSEKATQLHYLQSNPLCFVILGKPGIGEEHLGKLLADHWQCVLIEPELLVEQEIHSGSKAGNCIEFNLRCGRSIGIDVILKLVQKRVRSETARHRGFVLAGFPLIPNGLYEEDPVTSQSAVFTAKEIFDEVIDTSMHLSAPPRPPPSLSSKYKEEGDDEEESEYDQHEEDTEEDAEEETELKVPVPMPKETHQIPVDVGADYDVFEYADIDNDYETQLKFLFDVLEPPYLIIYIKSSTTDVINRRECYRYDLYSNATLDLLIDLSKEQIFQNYANKKDSDVDEVPEELFEAHFENRNRSNVKHLTTLPRDFPANVSTQLDSYHYVVMNFIEERVLLHDPQYFLKLDGRTDTQRMFNILKTRLDILPVQRVIIPSLLDDVEDAADVGEGPHDVLPPDEVRDDDLRAFCKRNAISDVYKWSVSDWGTRCPVSMTEGHIREGKRDFAVHFMNKLFFLSSEDAFLKFYRNPRPHLLPPHPKPSCKIYVYGPKCSGKTAVANCLAFYFGGRVLSTVHMLANLLDSKEGEYKEKIRRAAIQEATKKLNEMRKDEADEKEKIRIESIKDWVRKMVMMVEELINLLDEQSRDSKTTQFEISSFPMAMQSTKVTEMENEISIAIRRVIDELEANKVRISMDKDSLEKMLQDKKKFLKFLPDELRYKFIPKPATEDDDFVIDYANEAADNANVAEVQLNNMNIVEMFKNILKNVEEDFRKSGHGCGGWVLDGMVCDTFLLQELYPEFIADEVILLHDNDDDEFLLKRFETRGGNHFEDFGQFFTDMGRTDVALRCHPEESTASLKKQFIREILSSIIDEGINYESASIKRMADYKKELMQYRSKSVPVKDFFIQHDIKPIEIQVTGKSLPELMKEVIDAIESRYRVGASPFTEEDRAEEVKAFVDATVPEEAMAESPVDSNREQLEENRRYGDTSFYCPVALHDNWILWKGKEDLAAKFLDRLYLLSSPDALNRFLHDPRSFLPNAPPKKLPPPRICVIGLPCSGKTSLSKALSNNFGLTYVSFESILKKEFKIESSDTLCELFKNNQLNTVAWKYLAEGTSLSDKAFKNALSKLWNDYPLKKFGFVMDDFPKRPADIPLMLKYKFIPDIIVHVCVKDSDIHERLMETHMAIWQKGIAKQQAVLDEKNRAKIAEWEAKRDKRYHELLEEKREQRYADKKRQLEDKLQESEKVGVKSTSQVSFDSVAEMKDADEVNRLLDVELPDVLTEALESPEQAKANIERFIASIVAIENDSIDKVTKACAKEVIPVAKVQNEHGAFEITYRRTLFITDKIKNRTNSLFERCYDVSTELADKLIACGYFFQSKFAKTCPVQYRENKVPFQLYLPMEEAHNVFPVIHRYYIYYVVGQENLRKFKEQPLVYTNVEDFDFPLMPFKLGIMGPPKCGKTTLANRARSEYGMKVVSRGQAIRYVLAYLPYSDLAKNMEDVLRKGWEVTDEMVAACVEAASLDRKCLTQARRVPVPDERFDYLCKYYEPLSKVPAFLNVVDIAGLVKGASEGQGLGNAFLSHISACDAIFHLCRAFDDDDVTHVEGEVNPVRDLDIICEELRLKDEDTLMKNLEKLERTAGRGGDKKLKPEFDTLSKVKSVLVEEKKHIRFSDWDTKDIEILNKYLFLTSKPAIYLVNLAEKDYIKKKNKWLIKIKEWVDKNDPGATIIPFSGAFEHKLLEEYSDDPVLRKKFLDDNGTSSALDKIIVQGYKALQLEYFFTAGTDEVKAWTIQKATKAPQAAGRIHTDFEKGFIMAEVMKFNDFKEEGSEAACKSAGKYRQQGRNYVVEDGDIIFFKFNAGAGLQAKKK